MRLKGFEVRGGRLAKAIQDDWVASSSITLAEKPKGVDQAGRHLTARRR